MKTKARESYRYSNSILGFGWYTDTRDKKEELKKEILLSIKNTTAQVISVSDSYFK